MARNVVGWTYARLWVLVLGLVLLLAATLGGLDVTLAGWDASGSEHWAHWLAAVALVGVAFLVRDDRALAMATMTLGAVFLVTGAWGALAGGLGVVGDTEMADDVFHVLVGLVTLGAGFASRERTTTRARRVTV